MTNHTRTILGATTAIAAALALTAAPATAQDASTPTVLDGPIVNPVPAEPSSTAPTTTTPSTTTIAPTTTPVVSPIAPIAAAPTTTSTPIVQQVPETAPTTATTTEAATPAPTAKAPAPASERTAPAARPAAPAREASISTPAAETAEPAPVDNAAPAALAPLAQDSFASTPVDEQAAPQAEPTPEQAQDVTAILALVLAGLIGVGVAGLMIVAIRRRKQTATDRREAVARGKAPTRVTTTPVAATVEARSTPLFVEPKRPASARSDAAMLDSNGASLPLPSEMPQSFAERDALIRQMVAAEPDRANPFSSPKARLRRARLILQSLDRKFERSQPWIDLSEYPNNWPALAPAARKTGSSPAAPASSRILEPA